MDVSQIPVIEKYCDMFQVGARNMQNFTLLRELGRTRKPVLLKRGISATIEEWLLSAEYILAGGNRQVILCERGIRTFESYTRNTLDISAIPVVKKLSHLPIIVDPSHGTGRRDKVAPMARAAVAAGADGAHHRGAQRSGPRAERRRAVAVPGAVRPADGGAADHRAGHRPEHLPRAGDAARLERVRRARQLSGRIAIVGVGLIGGSVALAARRAWPDVAVVGVDRDDVARRRRGSCTPSTSSARRISTSVAGADLVVLAAPVRENLAGARQRSPVMHHRVGARSPTPAAPSARSSRPREPCRSGCTFVGGHPLAGAARGGHRGIARPTCSSAGRGC